MKDPKTYILIAVILIVAFLIAQQFQTNKRLVSIEREQDEVHGIILQEFGPCAGIPEGQCEE